MRWGWVITTTLWLLYSRERDPVSLVEEAVWTLGPVWTGVENVASIRVRPQTVQHVVSCSSTYSIQDLQLYDTKAQSLQLVF